MTVARALRGLSVTHTESPTAIFSFCGVGLKKQNGRVRASKGHQRKLHLQSKVRDRLTEGTPTR